MNRSAAIDDFWPSTQSLDIVKGSPGDVASAVSWEMKRYASYCDREPPRTRTLRFESLRSALGALHESTNVPTTVVVLPTVSDWTVLWNNSFLCDGWDSLCANLARRYGLETVHWSAHDENTTFQPGATFIHRRRIADEVATRSISVGANDGRWTFQQAGEALPEEDASRYQRRRIRDRFNESAAMALLERLGARPWADDFYAVGSDLVRIDRVGFPDTVIRRAPVRRP